MTEIKIRETYFYETHFLDFYKKLKFQYFEELKTRKKINIMSKKINTKLTALDDLINQEYGVIGSNKRDEFEEGFEAFKIGVMMHELRKELGMTQEQLAVKCGTTKNYISRIENNASDIRLSTLMRIFREGFGRQLKLSIG